MLILLLPTTISNQNYKQQIYKNNPEKYMLHFTISNSYIQVILASTLESTQDTTTILAPSIYVLHY
jgi:hypothetical protein